MHAAGDAGFARRLGSHSRHRRCASTQVAASAAYNLWRRRRRECHHGRRRTSSYRNTCLREQLADPDKTVVIWILLKTPGAALLLGEPTTSPPNHLLRTHGITDALKRHLSKHRSKRQMSPRRAPVPLLQPYLNFLDLPVPETCVWEQLTDSEKALVIQILTRLMVKLASNTNNKEQEHA